MSAFVQRCSFLIILSFIPLAIFSMTAADFNKAIAAANQQNQSSFSPQYDCPTNTTAPTHTQGANNNPTPINNTPATSSRAPIYYAPSAAPTTNNTPMVTTPAPSPTNNNNSGIVLGSSSSGNTTKKTTPPPFLVTY